MIRVLLAAAVALFAAPAATAPAPTIGGCGTAAIPKADLNNRTKLVTQRDCFAAAEAAAQAAKKARIDRLAALAGPTPTPPPTGNPITTADRAALIGQDYDFGGGNHIPGTAAPDVLGAFRFVCTPGPINWDDAIVAPGLIGGSPHAHQNYGNTSINGKSTHASLLLDGESTCSNKLNRSAYWVPVLLNAAGKVIRPDWINIYYKRLPASDPNCLRIAIKGCVGIPTGLRALSGYDMKRMGEAQPENATFHHRCVTDGRPSIHRKLLAEAVADCGGSGQVVSAVDFHECWNGELDSPDHRKHLAPRVWNNGEGHNAPWPGACPKSHPYLVPQLAQLLQYTIEKGDGDIHFSSDRMPGMAPMPGGSTFHADYIEAWDLKTRQTWETHCLDLMLSCSDGSLGDGTRLWRPVVTYKAEPRLVPLPARPTT